MKKYLIVIIVILVITNSLTIFLSKTKSSDDDGSALDSAPSAQSQDVLVQFSEQADIDKATCEESGKQFLGQGSAYYIMDEWDANDSSTWTNGSTPTNMATGNCL